MVSRWALQFSSVAFGPGRRGRSGKIVAHKFTAKIDLWTTIGTGIPWPFVPLVGLSKHSHHLPLGLGQVPVVIVGALIGI